MASITCYGGVGEIGGNKFLIEDRKTRIFLDFGESFGLLDKYFVDWLMPRGRFGLRDYFALDLMPKVAGLYNREALEPTDLPYSEPGFDAVFISHAHFDHTEHLQYLHPGIPIYMGETCKAILESTMETSSAFFFTEREIRHKDGTVTEANTVRTFRTGREIKVDSITVTPVHVDHSVPGAYGFIVETSEGAIAYTGDIRKHGNKPELSQDFVDRAREAKPGALLIEGTRVAPAETRKNHTEQIVHSESLKVCKSAEGLVLAMRYPKDLDRFRTFHEIAKETGKTLLISLKTAHLLLTLKDDKALSLPDPVTDDSIEIYGREMKRYGKWEKPLLAKSVDSEWVAKNQKSAIWELPFNQMQELIDVRPSPGGACIHSMSEPFAEDPTSQLQDGVLHNWLARFGMAHHQLHASGHASQKEIFGLCSEISPGRVIPVHTQYPELFRESGTRMQMIRKGETARL